MRDVNSLRSALATFVLLAAALAAGACVSGAPEPQQQAGNQTGNQAGGQSGAQKAQTGPVRIGFSMDTLKEERWQRDRELVEKRAREVGAQIQIDVANGDDARQLSQVDSMLTKGVDVLIVAPHNGVVAAAIVDKAHQQSVPVISYDRLIMKSDVDLYVSHQVRKIGEMQAEYALKRKPKGNYVLIGGSPTDNNAVLLREGQMNILREPEARGDIKIISNQFAKEWRREEAKRIVEDALTRTGNNIQAIVASNDGTAGGAVSALPPELEGQVLITGQDAQLDALQLIAEGKQTMTIYKPIQPLAYSAVDAAIKLARGERVETNDKINNEKIDVPAILHEPIAVDKDNLVSTVIKDGYHTMEDVYKKVPRDQWPQPPQSGRLEAPSRQLFATIGVLLLAVIWFGK